MIFTKLCFVRERKWKDFASLKSSEGIACLRERERERERSTYKNLAFCPSLFSV